MNVSIIGSGQVGKRIGNAFWEGGRDVIFYDVSKEALEIAVKGCRSTNYGKIPKSTTDIEDAIKHSDMSFVAVPTPVKADNTYDTSYLESACKSAGKALRGKKKYHIFVIKSTVVPGTTEEVIIPELENASGKRHGPEFGVIYNPEFLTVIQDTWTDDKDFCISSEREGRIVIGEGPDKKAGNVVEQLYKNTIFQTVQEKVEEDDEKVIYKKVKVPVPVRRTNYMTAEFSKLLANNRLPLSTSYTNELFLLCEELKANGINIDFEFAVNTAAMDPRIGKYGSVHGKAWGGPCFKKDTVAFRKWLEAKTDRKTQLINGTIEINKEMKEKYGTRE